MSYAAVPPILADDSKRRKNLDLDLDDRVALGFFSFTSKPSVSAVLFGFHGINLYLLFVKTSREFSLLDLDLEAF